MKLSRETSTSSEPQKSCPEVLLATPEPPEAVLWALYSTEEIVGDR